MGRAGRAKMEREYDERLVIGRYLDEIAKLAAEEIAMGNGEVL